MRLWFSLAILPLLAVSVMLCGCDGGGSTDSGPVPLVISGTWLSSCLFNGTPNSVTLLLHENNGRITGIWDGYLISVTSSGNEVAIVYNTVSADGLPMAVYLDGTIEGNEMSATITLSVNGQEASDISCVLERQP
jgi:hypothetical protein